MADGRYVSWQEWREWWASGGAGWFKRPAAARAQLPAPDLRTERLSTEVLSRMQARLHPESAVLTLEDRATLAMMGIRWP